MNQRFVICGALFDASGESDIVCCPATGDLILMDTIRGNMVMDSLTISDPQVALDEDVYASICREKQCDGVILSNKWLITLLGDKAYYYSYDDLQNAKHVVDWDTFVEFEESIDV